jgi:hypothetical protein
MPAGFIKIKELHGRDDPDSFIAPDIQEVFNPPRKNEHGRRLSFPQESIYC